MNEDNLFSRINDKYASMSKGQKRIANYIIDYYEKAVFFTAAKLGEVAGVSESTVVRFSIFLGYKGYPQFQQELANVIQQKLQEPVASHIPGSGLEENLLLDRVLQGDEKRIIETRKMIDQHAFNNAIDTILQAKNIYIIGIRSCAPLASYLAFYLNLIVPNVSMIQTSSSSEIFEQLLHVSGDDVVIGISFPRYSMRTLKAIEFANSKNAKVITLTDSIHSPMNLYSSCNLLAKTEMSPFLDSLVAPMSLLNALIMGVSQRCHANVVHNLETLEQIWDDYQVYDSDEINQVEDSIKMDYSKKG